MRKWGNNLITVAGTLTLSLLLSLFLSSDISLFAFMSKLNVGNDFHISDFYSRVANETQYADGDIAIIDVAECDRRQIAQAITSVEACSPAVIGADISFAERSDSITDRMLVSAINNCRNIVLATFADYDKETGRYVRTEFFSDSISGKGNYGNVRIETTSGLPTGVVRNFRLSYPLSDSDSLPSFAALIVRKSFPERCHANDGVGYIFFPGKDYQSYKPSEIGENKEALKGKIVLLGNYSGSDDLHRTPVSEQTYGIGIHAATISTILDGDHVKEIHSAGNWILAIVISSAILLIKLGIQSKKYGALTVRLCQILFIALTVLAGCYIFKTFHVVIDINKIVLMLMLSILSMDIWTGLYGFYSDISNHHKSGKNKIIQI